MNISNEEKIALIREGKYDLEVFIKENTKMVWAVLNSYKGEKILSEQDEEDLYAMGLGGIFYAVRDFDLDRGVKFSTFAWRYILTELQRHYREIQPHNYHSKTALSLSYNEYDFLEDPNSLMERYHIDLQKVGLTQKQQDWFLAYPEHQNFTKVGELFGVSKQAVRESIKQTQAKLRAKYY